MHTASSPWLTLSFKLFLEDAVFNVMLLKSAASFLRRYSNLLHIFLEVSCGNLFTGGQSSIISNQIN
jgi:hypothetical protein